MVTIEPRPYGIDVHAEGRRLSVTSRMLERLTVARLLEIVTAPA